VRIVAWNLKNIGQGKLSNTFSAQIQAAGLGNNVLEYIVNVVMAEPAWQAYVAAPADLFLVIELKSGGRAKGGAVSGTALPTLSDIVSAMNTVATNRKITGTYLYANVAPLVIGYHECVGIIYNSRTLTYVANSAAVLRTSANQYISPRTPFYAAFTTAANKRLAIVGIHAPPPSGKGAAMFRLPVIFTGDLADAPTVNQAAMGYAQEALCVGGDFNCDQGASFSKIVNKKSTQVKAFAQLVGNYGYSTQIPTGTLSSMRSRLGTVSPPTPTNYLSGAYDNIFAAHLGVAPTQRVLDLIANAMDTSAKPATALYPTRVKALFNAYWTVSDHMPVEMTY